MKKLAILYPVHYRESSGGAELQISYLCNAAKNAEWEVHYIYIPSEKNPIAFSEVEILHPLIPYRKRAHFFRYRMQIMQILDQIQPSLIYTRYSSSWIYYATEFAKNIKSLMCRRWHPMLLQL